MFGALFGKKKAKGLNRKIKRTTYAVGDIHGRFDLLVQLMEKINSDAERLNDECDLVFLGDYIDRGPQSREVVDYLIEIKNSNSNGLFQNIICLKGNHEAAILEFLNEPKFGSKWMNYGGNACLGSYGLGAMRQNAPESEWYAARDKLRDVLGASHLNFLNSLEYYYKSEDYLFVHAGIVPGVDLENQETEDLLTIREPFLSFGGNLDFRVVHGHTPSEYPVMNENRIGIDTGAYATNLLSAVKINNDICTII